MSYYLQHFLLFIHFCIPMILRSEPNGGIVVPHFFTVEAIDRVHNSIKIIVFIRFCVLPDKSPGKSAMAEKYVIDPMHISKLINIRQGHLQFHKFRSCGTLSKP